MIWPPIGDPCEGAGDHGVGRGWKGRRHGDRVVMRMASGGEAIKLDRPFLEPLFAVPVDGQAPA
jgi:hypothetical protein